MILILALEELMVRGGKEDHSGKCLKNISPVDSNN